MRNSLVRAGSSRAPEIGRAFHNESGPLPDPKFEEAEKEALSAVFASDEAAEMPSRPHQRHMDTEAESSAA